MQSKSLGSVFTNGNYMSCEPLLYFMRYMQYLLVLCFYLFAVTLRLHTEADMEEGIAIPSTAAAEEANTDLPQAQQQAAELQPGMTLLRSKAHLTSIPCCCLLAVDRSQMVCIQ